MNHLKIKRKTSKNYINQINVLKKYVAIKDSSKARKIFKLIIRKIIYDKLQKEKIIKEKIIIRIKFVRRAIKKIYEQL